MYYHPSVFLSGSEPIPLRIPHDFLAAILAFGMNCASVPPALIRRLVPFQNVVVESLEISELRVKRRCNRHGEKNHAQDYKQNAYHSFLSSFRFPSEQNS